MGVLIVGELMTGADMVGGLMVSIAHGGGAIDVGLFMVIGAFTGRVLTGTWF
jgi:hypothetical protein